ncbi:SDR family NAD(P)-dependent oxidoreductase [Nitrospira sp. BLG_1]|uniref:SDR family NAD(P)-dependent oxidoreductase n=1 Tax=Nitrospira sp. BLG_1 TaxID=3395883 RepID=UPI0039BC5B4D
MEYRTSPIPTETDQRGKQAGRPSVLVTGASGGIGRAISQAFGQIGWYVGVHYYQNKSAADTTLDRVRKVGGTGEVYAADIRESESVRCMFDQFSSDTQGPIAIVCNAGIGQSELLVRHSDNIWDNVIATNLTGTFHCLRACAPVLLARGGGSIMVIGSHTGFHGAKGQSAYATSKAGLIGLVKTAAREWGPQNIRVNLVLPGWQRTDLTEGIFPEDSGWLDHDLRRPPASEEMARTVVHLAQLNDISGQVWNCDSRPL